MKRSTLAALLLAALAGAAVLVFWPQEALTPQERIERQVLQMADAAEKKDLGGIMTHISSRFSGRGMKRDDLKRFLAAQVLRGTWVKVFVRDLEVTLDSPSAATFEGKFIFGRSEADTLERLAADSRIQGYEVTGTLELEPDGEWRFVTGTYRVVPPGQLF